MGTPPDPQQAIDWWLRAALNRNAHALFNLGVVVARGKHVTRDLIQAYRLLMEAEGLGVARSSNILATLRKAMSSGDVLAAERTGFYDALRFSRTPPPDEAR
jgi:TPR repeat protein